MTKQDIDCLVSTDWLAERLDAPDIRIIDASWYMPAAGRDPKAEYRAAHIPGAVFFDIDEISDEKSPYPHMLPSSIKFSSRMRKLGLGDGNRLIVYDGSGNNMSAPRVWWMLRYFGHQDVAVLDGGLKKWVAEGRPVDDRLPPPRDRHFTPRENSMMVRDMDQVRAIAEKKTAQIVDARSRGRFSAAEPEPRPGLRGGHMPGAISLPFTDLIDPAQGTFWPDARLAEAIAKAGIDMQKPVVTSCGSGVTACVVALALHKLGHKQVSVYDGSWSEWGAQQDTAVVTGV